MPLIGSTPSSFYAGLRPVPIIPVALFCSCNIPGVASGRPNTTEANVVQTLDTTVTGRTSGGSVWGSNPYTDDSDLNIAAVHAGLVDVGETAEITLFSPGDYATRDPFYIGSVKNGVTSLTWSSTWCGFYIRRKSVGVLNGIASASELVQYFGPAPGRAFKFITLSGINKINSGSITYQERGTSGLNNIVTKDYINAINYPLGVKFNDNVDDGWYTVPLGFNINFLGTTYNSVYIGTNFYLTFGSGARVFAGLNYSTPPLPKIMMGSGDHSIQRIWYGYINSTPGSRVMFIRAEGINNLHYTDPTGVKSIDSANYPGGPWQPGVGPKVYEVYFYENNPNVIDFHVIANSSWI